jgi:hypothetical protein
MHVRAAPALLPGRSPRHQHGATACSRPRCASRGSLLARERRHAGRRPSVLSSETLAVGDRKDWTHSSRQRSTQDRYPIVERSVF